MLKRLTRCAVRSSWLSRFFVFFFCLPWFSGSSLRFASFFLLPSVSAADHVLEPRAPAAACVILCSFVSFEAQDFSSLVVFLLYLGMALLSVFSNIGE